MTCSNSFCQIVSFNDNNFKNALLTHSPIIDTNSDGEIQVAEAESFNSFLSLNSIAATDLTGIEAFINATGINCAYNDLTSLDFSNNLNLTTIYCYNNRLTSLILGNNQSLTNLRCQENRLTSLDLSLNTGLEVVNCELNQLTALDVSNNTALRNLDCRNNHYISTLDLSYNLQLTELDCGVNDLTNLDVSNNTLLRSINVSSNNLASIDLANNINLTNLTISSNNFNTIDLSANINLQYLSCSYNNLTSLDLSQNAALTELVCVSNYLTNLNLSGNPILTRLLCGSNLLTEIDISNNIALKEFYISDNNLTSINLSENIFLEKFGCQRNLITSLDVSSNPNLVELNCHENRIESLNLSQNEKLTKLRCYDNRLTFLNIKNGENDKITNFSTKDNEMLLCIQVDGPSYSMQNWTDIDSHVGFSQNCENKETDILTFSLANEMAPAIIDFDSHTIAMTISPGTDLSNLSPIITISTGATISPALGSSQDFTSTVVYTVRAENPSVTQTWTVEITEDNLPPSNITLDNNVIDELNSIDDLVATFTSDDENIWNTHTYSLVDGMINNDNSSFKIAGDKLLANEIFDFENKANYLINVKSDDGSGGEIIKEFEIEIGNLSGLVQNIELDPIETKYINDDSFNLIKTASSGLDITYSSSDESVATISGNTITIVDIGTTLITANQIGDDDYNPAAEVQQSLTILKERADQVINFNLAEISSILADDIELSATSTSQLPITYSSSDESVATISGNTLVIVGLGRTTITASQPGNENFYAAQQIEREILIEKESQTITFSSIDDAIIGDSNFNLSATASSLLEIIYTSSDQNVATVSGNTVTIVGVGTTTFTAMQMGNDNYDAAESVVQVFTVNEVPKSNQSITFNAIENQFLSSGELTLEATASSGLEVSYEIVSGSATVSNSIVSFTELGIVAIKAIQNGNDSFFPATPIEQSFEIIAAVTSLDNNVENRHISLFPNPVISELHIDLHNKKLINWSLTDLNGKSIQVVKVGNTLNMRHLKKGYYMLNIVTESGIFQHKVVKMQ